MPLLTSIHLDHRVLWLVGTLEIIWSTPACCRSCNQGTAKRVSDSCEEGAARGSFRGPRAWFSGLCLCYASWVTSRPENASLTRGAPTPALHGKGGQYGHSIFRSKMMSFAVGSDFPFSKRRRWERDLNPSVGGGLGYVRGSPLSGTHSFSGHLQS